MVEAAADSQHAPQLQAFRSDAVAIVWDTALPAASSMSRRRRAPPPLRVGDLRLHPATSSTPTTPTRRSRRGITRICTGSRCCTAALARRWQCAPTVRVACGAVAAATCAAAPESSLRCASRPPPRPTLRSATHPSSAARRRWPRHSRPAPQRCLRSTHCAVLVRTRCAVRHARCASCAPASSLRACVAAGSVHPPLGRCAAPHLRQLLRALERPRPVRVGHRVGETTALLPASHSYMHEGAQGAWRNSTDPRLPPQRLQHDRVVASADAAPRRCCCISVAEARAGAAHPVQLGGVAWVGDARGTPLLVLRCRWHPSPWWLRRSRARVGRGVCEGTSRVMPTARRGTRAPRRETGGHARVRVGGRRAAAPGRSPLPPVRAMARGRQSRSGH
jgi:hypothetical protein